MEGMGFRCDFKWMACKVELFLGVLGVSSSWVWHTYQRVSDILKRNGSVIE